ncbi:MAG: T9SS type A sorting domain-containing protein [Bacteroidota bacterium]|nr:T9SS type A sorting domain-containing protein [Bacteroidota bacterium]
MIVILVYSGTNAQIIAGFELDGNATSVLPNPPDDWDKIYNNTHSAQITTNVVSDMNNIFQGGGSKDDLDINNWGWTTGSVPDKDDILHGGVALYNNCQLYFFADRYATNGSANIGFWLFKNNISVTAGGSFSGIHSVGDLLLVSEFVNGGGTAIIKAYKWVGAGGNVNGTLDSVPLTGVNAFAITNTTAVASPWPFVPKTGAANIFGAGAFFEGGIDLCAIPGLDPCFTSFLIETRSSFAIDAVLKDFLNGSFASSPQITLSGGSRCVGGAGVTLTPVVTGGVLPYGYSWSHSGGTSPSITVSPTSTTTYTLTVTGANGCAKTATATVTVNPSPNANAGIDKMLTCTTTSVALSGSSSTAGASFSWTTIGGNIVSGGSTATPTVNAAGTYILTVSSGAGCSASDTALVTFNGTPPNVNAGIDKTLNCLVTSVMLNGSSSTGGALYSWMTIGGNIVSGGTTATPTVNAAGTYILTVTNPANGCSAKDTAMVMLNNTLPNANAGADKTLTCTVTSVVLNGSSTTGGATFSWITIGGNIVSGGSTATPTVNAAGTYILTVTNPVNGCIKKDTAMVMLNNTLPNVNAGVDTVINCTNPSISLSGSSSTPGVLFSWITIGGNIVANSNTATPTVNAGGTYVLTVINPVNGCMASDTVSVSTNFTPPNANAGADDTLTCAVSQITLSGSSTTPGATFSWVATNGGAIFSGGNTATPIVQVPGTYVLTVTNPVNGCTAQDSASIYEDVNAPDVNAGPDKVLTCSVTSTMLNGSSSTGSATYLWTTVDGNIVSGATTLTPIVNAPGTYVLTVTNTITGCMAANAVLVTLNTTPPSVDAGANDTLNCTVNMLTLTGTSSNAGATFNWTTTSGNIVSGASTPLLIVNAPGTYVLTVTDSVNGCMAVDSAVVYLDNVVPNVNAGADETLTCIITSAILNGSSSTSGATFMWTTSTGNIISGAGTSTATVNAPGTYVLTVTNPANGCTSQDSATVILNNALPNANAGVDTLINCINDSISLSGSSTTANVSFNWTTSTGNIVSGANTANPIVDAAGTYVLTVTDNVNGCMASDSVVVTTDFTTPNVDAGADVTLTCVTTQANLNGSSTTPGATYAWVAVNGGVIISGGNTATPLVQIPGTYILTVTNPLNGCTASDSADVFYDNSVPNVDAGGDMVINCAASSIVLDGSSTTPGALIAWTTFGGGNIISGATTFNPTADMAGGYVLTITHPTSGCSASDTVMITVDIATPNVDAGADTVIGCGLATINLQGSTTSNAGMNWTTIGGVIDSGATSANPLVSSAGIYILTVIDRINGCSATDTVVVELSTPPVVDLGNDTTLVFCQGIFTLDAGNPGMTYMWSTTETTQTIDVTASGTYWVTVTNALGCPASDTINVTVNPGTVIVDLGNDTTFMNCNALPFVLDAGNPGATYVWSTTEITQTIVVTTSGTYYVTVTDSLGCSATDSINVTIIDNDIEVDLGNDTTICGCILLDVGIPGATYMWCSGESYPTLNVCETGTYCVSVSNGTCIDYDTINITVDPPPVVNLGSDTVFVTDSLVLNAGNPGATYLWSTGDSTVSITIIASGEYYVTVTDPSGCSASDTIYVEIINGVNENALNDLSMNVYPNPSSDNTFTLNFSLTEKTDVEIRIMNVLGNVIYSDKLKNISGTYQKRITLDDAASGVYFIDVLNGTQRTSTKIVLE